MPSFCIVEKSNPFVILAKSLTPVATLFNALAAPKTDFIPSLTLLGPSNPNDKVLTNIIGFSKPIPLLMLATDQLCLVDPVDIAEVLNSISTVGSLEIKPYSQNRFNSYEMDWTVFEEWIKKWLELDLNFELVNRRLLEESVSKQYNAFSDNHLYIMPNGDMNVLDFDLNDREYFKLIPTMADYYKWVEQEREMIKNNKFCKNCQWQGHCATEHYRNVKSLDKSCNGFKHLLDWYARLEN
jgi:hypothetical protein